MTKTIFVDENEDIFEAFENAGLEYDRKKVEHLRFISRKQSNNYIGYYQFKSGEDYYKFYILPKTSPKVEDENTNKQNFINLLKIYYELKSKYKELKANEIFDNVIDFSFDDKQQRQNSDDLDAFINYKYHDALDVVEAFFKKHKSSLIKEIDFISQGIKNRLNLRKNITELDKSKIHQSKKIPFTYSKFAVITMECLDYFLKKELQKKTKSQAKKLNINLKNRFKTKENFEFHIKQITSKKIKKLFKTKEQLELFSALLQLVGVENYFESESSKEIFKLHNQHSLFFRPEKLFEWIVYDKLKEKYSDYEILKDGFKNGTTKKYLLADVHRDSNPDFILKKEDGIIVVDAKWKILENKSDISFEDVAKLRRDAILNNANESILIYPQVAFSENRLSLEFDHFQFKIKELHV
ncbi:hypothetical protein [Sulfurovum sp.]|jgi:hypothetical protein|uniref:5-methylcytosine restriction system specificity protein McrC n=1 Tax=Sulfurovum sp. TaxID=1969726 RepID=UPI002A35C148|nr:hypothetical protein [Sulfurovum sp.]MDY0402201.1 hypothetical protein [Sulfurovum sp.]